jgi:hypothetical protein
MAISPATTSRGVKTSSLHPYHIVDPSPWPLVTSLTAFFIVFGLALYRHGYTIGFALFGLGLATTVFHATLWWRDIVREATFEGHHTQTVQYGLRFGRVLFIVSEIRLFLAFF